MRELPSGAHARLKASPSPLTSLTQFLVLTSQNLTTPSSLTLQSSASLTGLNATFWMEALWPLSSVEKRTCAFSGFQTRRVLSDDPVATRFPRGLQAIDLIRPGLLGLMRGQ